MSNVNKDTLHVVFTALPGPHGECVFVECEDSTGASVNAGEWTLRPDGLVELVIQRAALPEAAA